MYIVGLTGGIASGKSTVAAMLTDLGAYIIDTDKIARDVVLPNRPAWYEIAAHFGSRILQPDGNINRVVLGKVIFKNAAERLCLEKITHPYIEEKVKECIKMADKIGHKLVVIDIPLLFEVGWEKMTNETWVVYVSLDIQLSRLRTRNQLTHQQAMKRINAQMSVGEKVKRADVVIDNSSDIENTKKQVAVEWDNLCRKTETIYI